MMSSQHETWHSPTWLNNMDGIGCTHGLKACYTGCRIFLHVINMNSPVVGNLLYNAFESLSSAMKDFVEAIDDVPFNYT